MQKDEVESVSYMTINELKNAIEQGQMHKVHIQILKRILNYKKLKNIIINNEIQIETKKNKKSIAKNTH